MGKRIEIQVREKFASVVDALIDVEFVVRAVRRKLEKYLESDSLQEVLAQYKGNLARRSYLLFKLNLFSLDSKIEENFFRDTWNDIVEILEEDGIKAERIEE